MSGASTTVAPTATTTYTLTATNVAGSVTAPCTVSVIPAPSIVSLVAAPAVLNLGQSATLSWSVNGSGYSLSIDQGIGAVSGTSVVVKPSSTTTYTLTASNATGSTKATCTLPVQLPPVLGALPSPTFIVGKPGSFTLPAATDPNGSALTYSVSGLPAGLAFNPSTRVVSGSLATEGSYGFNYIVSDALGLSVTRSVSLSVGARTPTQLTFPSQTQYAYDDQGRLATLTYPSGHTVIYTYDGLDRVTAVSWNGQSVVRSIVYDGWSNRHLQVFQSTAADQWDYDPSGTLVKDWVVTTSGSTPQTRTYQYDGADRLIQAGEWTSLQYDANSRLVGAAGFGLAETFNYDGYDNNTSHLATGSIPNGMINFTFNPETDNHLPGTAANGGLTNVLWDSYGEILQVGTSIDATQDLSCAWDDLGRLAAVQQPRGAWLPVESYAYAASGYRVARIDSMDPTLNRLYGYASDGRLLSEYLDGSSGPAWNRDVVYLGGLAVAEVDAAGVVHELHSDSQGTPRICSSSADPAGSVGGTQAYGPYGETLGSFTNNYVPLTGYTGHLQTEPNGLIYMRGRFYSPAWHCFLNSDQGVGTLNQYVFCGGNPIMLTDPAGLWPNGNVEDGKNNDDQSEADRATSERFRADAAEKDAENRERASKEVLTVTPLSRPLNWPGPLGLLAKLLNKLSIRHSGTVISDGNDYSLIEVEPRVLAIVRNYVSMQEAVEAFATDKNLPVTIGTPQTVDSADDALTTASKIVKDFNELGLHYAAAPFALSGINCNSFTRYAFDHLGLPSDSPVVAGADFGWQREVYFAY